METCVLADALWAATQHYPGCRLEAMRLQRKGALEQMRVLAGAVLLSKGITRAT